MLRRHGWTLLIVSCLLIDGYIYFYGASLSSGKPGGAVVTHSEGSVRAASVGHAAKHTPNPRKGVLLPMPTAAFSSTPPTPPTAYVIDSPPPPHMASLVSEQPGRLPGAGADTDEAVASYLPIDALAVAANELHAQHCQLLVATAVFERAHLLRQPKYCSDRRAQEAHRRGQRRSASAPAARCHVAFVDWQSERLLKQHLASQLAKGADGEPFVGCWQLLRVPAGLPYVHGDANARLARASLARLFPGLAANGSLWVDAARQLLDVTGPKLSSAAPARSDRADEPRSRGKPDAHRTFKPPVRPAPRSETAPAVHFKPLTEHARAFGGASDDERDGALQLLPAALHELPCGFVTPSVFDGAAAIGSSARCEMLTLTAIFDAYDELIQPTDDALRRMGDDERGCFYALVDKQSHDLLLQEGRGLVTVLDGAHRSHSAAGGRMPTHKIGVWTLLLLDPSAAGGGAPMPFGSSRRNSRVPKMLAHRLFPQARYALWIDSKLRLHQPPSVIRKRFLPTGGGAVFAAYRNLRRDHIDEERDWIWKHKCDDDVSRCPELFAQWDEYEAEQDEPTWAAQTVAIEGSLLLQDLRAPLHNALFCNWFNEYLRHGERDQMAISYVLHRMGLTANGTNASRAVRLIGHEYHYLTKPSRRPLTLVQKLGHRGSVSRRKVLSP